MKPTNRYILFLFLGLLSLKSLAQKPLWVQQISCVDPREGLRPLGLEVQENGNGMAVFKASGNYAIGRKVGRSADSLSPVSIRFNSQGEASFSDSVPLFLSGVPILENGNSWLLKTRSRNGNYFLAYGLSSPSRLPIRLSWNLAYIDVNGHRLWEKALPESMHVYSIALLRNGSCLLAGSIEISGKNQDLILMIINEYGKELWRKSQGGKGFDAAFSAAQDLAGNIFVGGVFSADSSFLGNTQDLSGADQDGFVSCYSEQGAERFFYRQRGPGFGAVYAVAPDPLGKLFFLASFSGKSWHLPPFGLNRKSKQDLVVGLLDPTLKEDQTNPLTVFPNPAREIVYFGLEKQVFDKPVLAQLHKKGGEVLQQMQIRAFKGNSFRFNVANTPPGAYYISLKSGKKTLSQRVVVE